MLSKCKEVVTRRIDQKRTRTELEQLHSRLRSVEEDVLQMKRALASCSEERAAMVAEIVRRFQLVRTCLARSPKMSGSDFESKKDGRRTRRIGLSEVLVQDSNPILVTRDMKVNVCQTSSISSGSSTTISRFVN